MTAAQTTADLVQIDKALESYRDSGYDLTAAVGEIVDNSIEGEATLIRIDTNETTEGRVKRIDRIAFADNGIGIDPEVLAKTLSMGFSTRYGSRDGIGRFGVGMKLATLSQARRIDVYTRPRGDSAILHTFLDLDEVQQKTQKRIEAREVDGYPDDLEHLMHDDDGPFESGTLVVWSKVDRLEEGGRYGASNVERLQELTRFLARAYRKFIDNGLEIRLNKPTISLHDPLFLLDNPRVIKRFGPNVKAEVIDRKTITIEGHDVEVVVTLLPEEFRHHRGHGGSADRDDSFKDLYIPYNEGRISFMRQGREINYDIVARMLPSGVRPGDRFIGIEVDFPAALDEYFEVRNVKRGVVPVSKLREELRKFLKRAVAQARKQIKRHWNDVKAQENASRPRHQAAQDAVAQAEQTTPRGRAGGALPSEEEQRLIGGIVDDVLGDEADDAARETLRDRLARLPISLVDDSWPGKEMLEIQHLDGRAIVRLNRRHPFLADVYEPIQQLAAKDSSDVDPEDVIALAQTVETAIDILLMAYAKAENMHSDPENAFSDLRTDWGRFTAAYVREAIKE